MENQEALERIEKEFNEWLHIEDPYFLKTLLAIKVSHKLPGDPIWLMLIGPSSDGKSEYLRALTQEDEVVVDDLTPKTFVSGMSPKLRTGPQFAERLTNKIWYIYDMSIMLSKRHEDRSTILSDMRMIYDGKIVKGFGNSEPIEIEVGKNTLIAGSTPEIDATMLEDALLGTRFITYRIQTKNRFAVMTSIDVNEDRIDIMREKLNLAVKEFESSIKYDYIELNELENQNIQLLTNATTLLRATVSLDKSGEPRNIIYPEGPGRVYKQLKKLYKCYKILGLEEEEILKCIRKICQDNINPVRLKLLNYLSNGVSEEVTTSNIHTHTGLGKKTIKSHMHAMNMMGLIDFRISEEGYQEVSYWSMRDSNLNILFDKPIIYPTGQWLRKYTRTENIIGQCRHHSLV
jgi:hypothetical protein